MTSIAARLTRFSTCDLADSLTKLGINSFIPDVTMRSPLPTATGSSTRIAGPAHTVEFVDANDTTSPKSGVNQVDSAPSGSIVVIKTPHGAINAVWGGLMSARAQHLNVAGTIIEGRCRDLNEQYAFNYPLWASGTSTLGVNGYCRVATVGSAITLAAHTKYPVTVNSKDWIVADIDGVVRVPAERVEEVLTLVAEMEEVDALCMQDIKGGRSMAETFKERRKPKM
ncbi:hypothetical protein SmJEL517_g00315 [Synchytrium microbalum]|uniref:4-hydroxy-4-methyl-2-oxoglutarate aldolase n=1 Tax=Synchytrium microbalum TaxID=1806994 RepID=A0A507CIM5_9FUNG|nr:uncharacterized protein SmJEL517_g00315 [Synchytrium microbalum]TPX38076.1 hypothetical protein SmJEL517_g00315 [Synchytrium microbalum]